MPARETIAEPITSIKPLSGTIRIEISKDTFIALCHMDSPFCRLEKKGVPLRMRGFPEVG